MASSSSTQEPHRHHLFHHKTTAAPPPTPSSQPTSDDSTAAALTSLLHRLPTTLSLPSRLSRRHTGQTKPIVPTVSLNQPPSEILSAASQLGFFQLTDHRVTAKLAESSESESAEILALSPDHKHRLFPANWPLGFDPGEEDEKNASFCMDDETLTSANRPGLTEFMREMERVGVEVVEMLKCALDLANPVRGDERVKKSKCSLMWVSEFGEDCKTGNRCYPYVVGLTYQVWSREYRLETDTGSVMVEPPVGSVLVTLGDIAQVWSNGKTKKVRGMPIPTANDNSILMCLLITLPLDATVSPLLFLNCCADDGEKVSIEKEKMIMKFNPIPFEDYAWRVYHERLFLKDALDRYRI